MEQYSELLNGLFSGGVSYSCLMSKPKEGVKERWGDNGTPYAWVTLTKWVISSLVAVETTRQASLIFMEVIWKLESISFHLL